MVNTQVSFQRNDIEKGTYTLEENKRTKRTQNHYFRYGFIEFHKVLDTRHLFQIKVQTNNESG